MEKPPFSSKVFDINVPNQQVEYQFFNAFKQIQVEMERLKMESKEFSDSMSKTKDVLMSIDDCTQTLNDLDHEIKQEKIIGNNQESQLEESQVIAKYREIYSKSKELEMTLKKLNDPTYTQALKMRGFDQDQENLLIKIDSTIKGIETKIEEWREFQMDENNQKDGSQQYSPNEIYKTCKIVENYINEKYNKYIDFCQQIAPELLIQNLNLSPPRNINFSSYMTPNNTKNKSSLNSFASSLRESLPSSPKSDVLYRRYMNLRKSRRRSKINRLSKYEKRLNISENQTLKPITTQQRYIYSPYITPKTTNISNTQSPHKSPNKENQNNISCISVASTINRATPNKLKQDRKESNNLDLSKFSTKIQHTPCKLSKKPPALKKLATEKNLSRQESAMKQSQPTPRQQIELQFQRTPGFGTVKRRHRRRAARLDTSPYKPPKKPDNFVEFSPKKNSPQKHIEMPSFNPPPSLAPQHSSTSPQRVAVAVRQKIVNNQSEQPKPQSPAKPKLELAVTLPISLKSSQPQQPQSSNDILGLTSTPPALKNDDKKEDDGKQNNTTWSWGNLGGSDDKKKEVNTDKITNPFGSFTMSDKTDEKSQDANNSINKSGWENVGVSNNDPTSIYKSRITEIYQQMRQTEKLAKLMAQIDQNRGDIGWMHSLYVKICNKYNVEPQPMVSNNNSNWNNLLGGNSKSGGFGSMSGWGTQNNKNNNNVTNNPWTGFGSNNNGYSNNNNNNNNNSWGNWGSVTHQVIIMEVIWDLHQCRIQISHHG